MQPQFLPNELTGQCEVFGTVAASIAVGAMTAGSTLAGATMASRANTGASKRATAASLASNREALQFERENEQRRREEYDRAEAENRREFDLALAREREAWLTDRAAALRGEQRNVETYNAEQRRRQPYRDASLAAVQDLARRVNLTVTPTQAPQLQAPTMADLVYSGPALAQYPKPVTGGSA